MLKIFLGKYKGETYYLQKHKINSHGAISFGLIGNNSFYIPFNQIFLRTNRIRPADMETCNFDEPHWWVILDMMKQAFALENAMVVYKHGGYLTHLDNVTDIILNTERSKLIQDDLEKVLDKLWEFMEETRLDQFTS